MVRENTAWSLKNMVSNLVEGHEINKILYKALESNTMITDTVKPVLSGHPWGML